MDPLAYIVAPAAGVLAFVATLAIISLITRPAPPERLNWPGVILWYVGAVNANQRARALHPVTWIVFIVAMLAHGAVAVWKAARETRGEWVAW